VTKKIVVKRKTEAPAKKKSIVVKKQRPITKGFHGELTTGQPAVGKTKKGKTVRYRFCITKFHGVSAPKYIRDALEKANMRSEDRWFVMDNYTEDPFAERSHAKGTSKTGYSTSKEAAEVCKEYSDKYGRFMECDF
jgi:hypothetical protein